MKKQILMSMLLIAAFVGFTSAVQAQSQLNWSGKVPFEFNAGGKAFAAGEYKVKIMNPSSDRPALLIQNAETRETVIVQTMSDSSQLNENATLNFRRYGTHYFFAGVQAAGDSLALRVARSKHERTLRMELARNGESATLVAVKSE